VTDPPLTTLACPACGAALGPRDPYPFRCPNAGRDEADHVLVRSVDPARVRFAADDHTNPFVRHRELLHSFGRARAGGLAEGAFTGLVEALDRRIAEVDGHGFTATPFAPATGLAARLDFGAGGAVWVKDETDGVSGSHKARHLFGLALHLEVSERLGLVTRAESDRRGLAIASCGNAALAAAVVARAAARPLAVFIPADADPHVVERLHELGARIAVCPRRPEEAGDPCLHAFRRALAAEALPFCVQGPENGLAIEGGETLAWEMATALGAAGAQLDRLLVQVGGGALASACAQGLAEAVRLGVLDRLPRLHAVQTESGWPLKRAYERVRALALGYLGERAPAAGGPAEDAALAERLLAPDAAPAVERALREARAHRGRFMWPWETPPRSVAYGILDDETYDWFSVVAAMLRTGGFPLTVGETLLHAAQVLARQATGLAPCATATAGLAGLMELRDRGVCGAGEQVAVLFSGVERGA
jgi:threonine synthase